jgi:hypothetical protein
MINFVCLLFFRKLYIIKQVHNEFMGGLDVTMTYDFYQAPPFEIHGFSNQ